jgi:hypothetical protein
MRERANLASERYGALGGPAERVVKEGADPHPHGLTDPVSVVTSFEEAPATPKGPPRIVSQAIQAASPQERRTWHAYLSAP